MWNLLQLSDGLDFELAAALAESVSVNGWQPIRSISPQRGSRRVGRQSEGPGLSICTFPIVRGYTRFPISQLVPTNRILLQMLLDATPEPAQSPLICTIPYFAGLAELWPGPVVYWLTDLMVAYAGVNRSLVTRSDRRLCRAATLVCANSQRIADYLVQEAGCDPAKIHLLPNAVRAQNLLPAPLLKSLPLQAPVPHLPRPVAGVIGNMAANHDWVMLQKVIEYTPAFSWLFIGPTSMRIEDGSQRRARAAVMRHPRCTFVGKRPYGELVHFSRALDVAILPYADREPTSAGSSTRFYEHLAACRPMIAFPGVAELRTKSPLVSLVTSAEAAANQLELLRHQQFDDGVCELRWRAAVTETWQTRARSLQKALATRLAPQHAYSESDLEVPSLQH